MSAPEWAAEHEVGAEQAAALIAARFPELAGLAVTPLATGWDNTVHLVGEEWVFRFPRRAIALPLLAHETAVLPRLAGRLPLPVPCPEFVGEPAGGYPWPYWGARLVPGVELADSGLPDPQRVAAAADLGAFLRTLHDPALAVAVAAAVVLPVDPMRRGDAAVRAPMARERLDRLAAQGTWQPDPAVHALLDAAEPLGWPDGSPVLVHGDLHQRHLLLDGSGRASGVIDWGDVCLADPALDLSLAYGGFTGAARTALLDAYGPVPAEREARARVLAVFLSATLAEYAHGDGRPALLRESLAGISRAAR
ncbi:phosphotransferase [Catellatospora sp. NPDC049609]|uniref:phosphotransferase n=1 Tax=Catellatospora sp. NPDC049609 TaxID=3155505 RepID=UPI003434295B